MTVFRWIVAVIICGLVGMCTMGALKPRVKPPTEVQTTKVGKTTVTRTVSGAGKLEPARKINVSALVTGVLLDLKVDIGSQVKKGDYLGQIDTSRYEAQVRQQQGQVAAARADVERLRLRVAQLKRDMQRLEQLAGRDAIGLSELDTANAALNQAQAELAASENRASVAAASLREAQQNVEWGTLRAPVDGTVLAVNKRVGERIRGSDFSEDVVLVIGSVSEMEVKIEVGEHDVVWIKPGQRATIEIDALPDQPLAGVVIDNGRDAIVKNAGTDNEVTTFPVWVALDAPPETALSGMSAQVQIETETKENVLAVPIQAVTVRPPAGPRGGDDRVGSGEMPAGRKPDAPTEPQASASPDAGPPAAASDATKPDARGRARAAAPAGGPPARGKDRLEKVVFVVKDGKVERRKVTTGLQSDTQIEIVDGVGEGEEIVEGPYRVLARQLQDGDEVQVQQPGGPGGPGRRPGGGGGGPGGSR